MTTPPEMLVAGDFWFDGLMVLRSAKGEILEEITAATALAMAYNGEIEGVGSTNGRIKYLRILPASARRNPLDTPRKEETHQSTSTGFARTNIGVYREPIVSSTKAAAPFLAGFVIGYCYAHCQLRGSGL